MSLLQVLIEENANVNIKDKSGNSPIMIATTSQSLKTNKDTIIKELIQSKTIDL